MQYAVVVVLLLLSSLAGLAQELEQHTFDSCRENTPSINAIFRQVPDEPLESRINLQGDVSKTTRNRMDHLREFLSNRITLQSNRPIPLTLRERLRLFTDKTVTQVQPYASSLVSAAILEFFSPTRIWGQGTDEFTNHVFSSFTRRVVTYGIQSSAAAALHEDLRYKPSLSSNVWKRTGHALLSTLIIETPNGNGVAFANIVAAHGSGAIINSSHPGQENIDHQGTWSLGGKNLLGFAEGNLWSEFKPDLQHFLRTRLLRQH
jgi:hypothetical protein